MTETAASSLVSREDAPPAQLAGGDPEAMAAFRGRALAAYRELPWPASSRDEDWRRTPQVDRLDPAAFAVSPALGGTPPSYLAEVLASGLGGPEVSQLVVTDQRGNLEAGSAGAGPVRELGPALAREPELWGPMLGRVVAPGLRKLVALNGVRTNGGACIHVGAGQQPSGYVRLVYGVDQGSASFPRTLIRLEEGASLTVLEEWVSPPADASLLAPVTEIELARGAHLTHVLRQACGERAVVQSTVRVHVGQEGRYDGRWTLTGGAWEKEYVEVLMLGQGSEARLVGLSLGAAKRHSDLQTLQDHVAPGAVSDLLHRVAVADRARSVYAGLIRVEEDAQKTNAYVQNRNLLLSPTAKADSNPTLEILSNDVRCTHGSTAGRIDDEQLFYCHSRGIGREEARRLVVEGFFADVVDAFPEGSLRDAAGELVLGQLGQLIRPDQPLPAS